MTDDLRGTGRASLAAARAALERIESLETYGRVVAIRGLLVEVAGPVAAMRLGGRLDIEGAGRAGLIPCEIIGFQGDRALAMPFGSLEGVRRGCPAYVRDEAAGAIRPSGAWLGRVVDALGRPVDGLGPAAAGAGDLSLARRPAPRPRAAPRRRPARSRHSLHQHLPDHVRRPAHGHLRRLRRRQVGAALDARPLHRRRRGGDRPRRRARARGPGIPPGRSRRPGPRPLGGRGGDLRRAGPDAPQRRLRRPWPSPSIFATRAPRSCA